MESATKTLIASIVIILVIGAAGAYVFLNSALAPLEQTQDKTILTATSNVEIQANTFSGNIEIQSITGSQIEVIYNIQTPKGHLAEIVSTTTNQSTADNTQIQAKAKIENSNTQLKVNYRADITIKLPNNKQYNLTLNTLNGNIIKPQLNNTKITAQTGNGNIDISDGNAASIDASSQNGNVKINLARGTLFQVDATTANGHVTYQGIALNTNTQTSTHLNGVTSDGSGELELKLSSANGNITITYFAK